MPADPTTQKQRTGFQKGASGNPAGRVPGSRNRVLMALDAIGADAATDVLNSAVAAARGGDVRACELLLSRVWPARRGRPVTLPDMPAMQTPADLVAALGTVAQAVAAGTITPDEGAAVASVLDMQRRAIETADLATRVETLERVKL